MARRDAEQVGGALALLPQRCAFTGPAAGEKQRPGGRLAEARSEQRGRGELADDEVLHLVGIDEELLDRDLLDGLRQAQHDAVVAPEHLDLEVEPLGETDLERERPRRVDA